MRLLFYTIVCLLTIPSVSAQTHSNVEFFGGYGYYEGFHSGCEYYFNQRSHSINLSVGYNNIKRYNQVSYSLAIGYDFAIFRDRKNGSDNFKWNVSNRAVLWQLEDEYYLWRAISLIPSISRRFTIYKGLDMSVDAGPSFNIVLYNDRKTFREVGWPYHVLPNARILLIF